MKTGPEIKWERSNHQHTQKLEYKQSILPLKTVYMDGMYAKRSRKIYYLMVLQTANSIL